MPKRQWSNRVNLNNSQKTTELLPPKHKKIMAFPPTATFGQLFPFQTSFEAKLFSSPETVVVWLTRQQKPRTEIRTKATGLCAKSRRAVDGGVSSVKKFGIVRMPELKILENVLKAKETATAHARKHFLWGMAENWDENGQERPFAA